MVATPALIGLLGTKLKYLGKLKATTIDNGVFKLHYRWTFNLLIVACAVVTSTQFFGDPISCIKTEKFINQGVINNYCWIEGTFTLPKALTKSVGDEVVMPGIERKDENDEVLEHAYYQWVCWVLFLQALAFYATRCIWKAWEHGYVSTLVSGLNKALLEESKKKKQSEFLVDFLKQRRGQFDGYALKYWFCEILNFVHVIIEIFITNIFLGGQFLAYGYQVMVYNETDPDEINPMTKVFPKMTKCSFSVFGSSGDVQKYDNFCLLPLNIINEKIYLFLWCWFLFLAIISAIDVLYRLFSFVYPPCRYRLLQIQNRRAKPQAYITLIDSLSFGDWFVLYLIGQNIEPAHFTDILELFALQLETAAYKEVKKDEIQV